MFDFAILGGGIVGLAIAMTICRRAANTWVVVFEKESALACHQSGRNSDVLFLGYGFGLPVVATDVASLKEEITEDRPRFPFRPEIGRIWPRPSGDVSRVNATEIPQPPATDPGLRQRTLFMVHGRAITKLMYASLLTE